MDKQLKWNMDFISRDDYIKHVTDYYDMINSVSKPKNIQEFNKNIIDPIKLTFSYFSVGENIDKIISNEQMRPG